MAWQKKAAKMSMGKFVRAKKGMMVLVTFTGEPNETVGKNFNGDEVDELQFPVDFFDARPVSQRYAQGEAANIVMNNTPEEKLFPVQGGPLLREILEVDEVEGLVGKTFIVRHTGEGQTTAYKFTEVLIKKQAKIVKEDDEEPVEEIEEIEEEKDPNDTPEHAGPNPRKDPPKRPSKDPEKEKFMKEVKKRTKKAKEQEAQESSEPQQETDEAA